MKLPENIKKEIVEALEPIHPEKVVLFGSYAYGVPHENSDIDLLVVTSEDFMPSNYKERMQVVLRVARAIRSIKERMPVDLIVHTKAMHRKFIEINSLFAKEILSKGVELK